MKKGELTTTQIITLVILIVSFIVILFLLFRLNLGKETDKELCHNSVVTRGSSVLPSDVVPLNCHRSYVCLTKDGTCEKMTNPEIKKVKTEEEIYQVLADEMADCWWMFGEGKVDYIGKKVLKENYCSICSQLAFDDSLKNIEDEEGNLIFAEGEINKDELYDFLAVEKISGKEETYAEYLFGTKDVNQLKQMTLEQHAVDGTFGMIDLDKQYFVVMGITNEVGGIVKWATAGGAVIGIIVGSIVIGSNPVGWIVGAVVVGGVAGAGGAAVESISDSIEPEIAAITIQGNGIDNEFMAPTIQEANSDKFKSLNCEDIMTLT